MILFLPLRVNIILRPTNEIYGGEKKTILHLHKLPKIYLRNVKDLLHWKEGHTLNTS